MKWADENECCLCPAHTTRRRLNHTLPCVQASAFKGGFRNKRTTYLSTTTCRYNKGQTSMDDMLVLSEDSYWGNELRTLSAHSKF